MFLGECISQKICLALVWFISLILKFKQTNHWPTNQIESRHRPKFASMQYKLSPSFRFLLVHYLNPLRFLRSFQQQCNQKNDDTHQQNIGCSWSEFIAWVFTNSKSVNHSILAYGTIVIFTYRRVNAQ